MARRAYIVLAAGALFAAAVSPLRAQEPLQSDLKALFTPEPFGPPATLDAPVKPPSQDERPSAEPDAEPPLPPRQAKLTKREIGRGLAAWYDLKNRTASGEQFSAAALTAGHRTLPFGTEVEVLNLRNGRSVTVRITDRGPFTRGRVIDLSRAAAQAIEMTGIDHVALFVTAPADVTDTGALPPLRKVRRMPK